MFYIGFIDVQNSLKMVKMDRNMSDLWQILRKKWIFNLGAFIGFILWIVPYKFMCRPPNMRPYLLATEIVFEPLFWSNVTWTKSFERKQPAVIEKIGQLFTYQWRYTRISQHKTHWN